MSDPKQRLHDSIVDISQAFDASISRARSEVHNLAAIDIHQTIVFTRAATQNAAETMTLEFRGPNAPVIARPVTDIAHRHATAERNGHSGRDRIVTITGGHEQIESVTRDLREFSRIVRQPEMQRRIEQALAFAFHLEHITRCKVFLDFDVEGSQIEPRLKKIITLPDSPLAALAKQCSQLQFKPHPDWRESNMKTHHDEGIEISATGQEAEAVLLAVAETFVLQNLPPAVEPLQLKSAARDSDSGACTPAL